MTTVPMTLQFLSGHIANLRQNGWQVVLISSGGDGELRRTAADTADMGIQVEMRRHISPVHDLVSLLHLVRALGAVRPDVVHAHSPKAGLLAILAAKLVGAPAVVLSVFGLPQMTLTGVKRHLLNGTTRLAGRFADVVWCDSPSMADYVVAQGLIRADKVVVLGQGSVGGVDAANRFNPERYKDSRSDLRRTWGVGESAAVVGFVGRVTPDKGIREIARAWEILRSKGLGGHLVLVGPREACDTETSACLRQLERLPEVTLLGRRDDIPELLSAMDIFVMPSYREGFGISILEASAMGLPVVASRIPGCVDSVEDGVTGTLVPPRDAQALAEAIEGYINNHPKARDHGEKGRRRAEREFSQGLLHRELEQVYMDLLNMRKATDNG